MMLKKLLQRPVPRRPNAGRVILVTGASTGLGLAIARRLLGGPDQLILTAREDSLSRFAEAGIEPEPRVWIRPLDVTSDEQRRTVVAEALERFGAVDVLINNAGVSYRSVIEHIPEDDHRTQMEVNYLGPIALSRLVLPAMREQRSGRIVQISSAGGLMAMPTMGAYAASKFALEAATEALYYEVRPFGIHVSLVLPGFINSEGFRRVVLTGEAKAAFDNAECPYHPHYKHMSGFIARLMRKTPTSTDAVARKVVKTINRRWPPLRVATFDTRLLWWFRRFTPHRIHHALLYRLLPGVREWSGRQPPRALLESRSSGSSEGLA